MTARKKWQNVRDMKLTRQRWMKVEDDGLLKFKLSEVESRPKNWRENFFPVFSRLLSLFSSIGFLRHLCDSPFWNLSKKYLPNIPFVTPTDGMKWGFYLFAFFVFNRNEKVWKNAAETSNIWPRSENRRSRAESWPRQRRRFLHKVQYLPNNLWFLASFHPKREWNEAQKAGTGHENRNGRPDGSK